MDENVPYKVKKEVPAGNNFGKPMLTFWACAVAPQKLVTTPFDLFLAYDDETHLATAYESRIRPPRPADFTFKMSELKLTDTVSIDGPCTKIVNVFRPLGAFRMCVVRK